MRSHLSHDVARVIRGLLAERRITTKDFSASIGIPNSTVDRWLKGGKMSTDALDPLAEGLGMTVDQLVVLALQKREENLRKGLSGSEADALDEAIRRTSTDDPTPEWQHRQERGTGS